MADTLDIAKTNATLAKLDGTIDDLVKSLQGLVKSSGDVAKAHEKEMENSRILEDAAKREFTIKTKNKKLSDDELKIREQYIASYKEANQAEKDKKNLTKLLTKADVDRADVERKLTGVEQRLLQINKEQEMAVGKVSGLFGKFAGPLSVLLTFLGGVIVGEYKRQKEAMALTAGMIDLGESFSTGRLTFEKLTGAAGLDYDQTIKTITANRQAVNAMGGTQKAMATWTDDVKQRFTAMTGDIDEGFRLFLESQGQLRKAGVTPSVNAMQRYAKDVQKLATLTGMQAQELETLYNEVATDIDSQVLLKAAREGEREAILASQRALINMNVAAGMTAEQAKEAAKMLNKMVAAKPIERMKQAARMRALGAAFGVAGGEQAAQAMIAGPRASAEQKQNLMEFNKSITTVADQMRGQGLGQEIFSTTLLEKLDLDKYYGADSSFSTTLTGALKSQAGEFRNAMGDMMTKPMIIFQENANRFMNATQGNIGSIAGSVGKIYDWLTTFSFGTLLGFGGKKGTPATAAESQMGEMMAAGGVPMGAPLTEASKITEKAAATQQVQSDTAKEHKAVSERAATGIDNQLKHMSNTNDILMKIHENSEKQVDIAEKQLAATLMTEKEKGTQGARAAYLEGNRSFTNYGFVA